MYDGIRQLDFFAQVYASSTSPKEVRLVVQQLNLKRQEELEVDLQENQNEDAQNYDSPEYEYSGHEQTGAASRMPWTDYLCVSESVTDSKTPAVTLSGRKPFYCIN